jgi:hypothetical protein
MEARRMASCHHGPDGCPAFFHRRGKVPVGERVQIRYEVVEPLLLRAGLLSQLLRIGSAGEPREREA